MLILKRMRWSNVFSYGPDNEIDFSAVPLLQLVGKNGYGKTSISLILEEVLFNKNSKGIKKADILNRYGGAAFYTIELDFEKDGLEYTIYTKRGSTQTVKLLCSGEDISSHTATNTYKQIEEIIGMDHKTFTQIVILLNAFSLEFLVATDSARKKFLIDLLSLDIYTSAGEVFKTLAKGIDSEVTYLTAQINSTQSWLTKNSSLKLAEMPLKETVNPPTDLEATLRELKVDLLNINTTNKSITTNNQYKQLMDGLVVHPPGHKPDLSQLPKITQQKNELEGSKSSANALITKLRKLGSSCPTCLQEVSNEKVSLILNENQAIIDAADEQLPRLIKAIEALNRAHADWEAKVSVANKYEQYHSLYNPDLPTDLKDASEITAQLVSLEKKINAINKTIVEVNSYNAAARENNIKMELVTRQMAEYSAELVKLREGLVLLNKKLSDMQILVKAFSPSGLVAYKIECSIKDLEEATNEYLNEMSDGRFQLSFQITGNDKLSVIVTDNGTNVDIQALSSGERARVNVSALLGIRNVLQALTKNKINLLFLDETMENLDLEGKDRLIEVLLAEQDLNTVIVSHSFSHPLVEKLMVVKEKNISRIDG